MMGRCRPGGSGSDQPSRWTGPCRAADVVLASDGADVAQCRYVGDARQDELRRKQGQEAVRCNPPPSSSLGEVLEAGQDQQTLGGRVGDNGRQIREWGDVGQFVKGPNHRWPWLRAAGNGLSNLLQEGHDERGVLMVGTRVCIYTWCRRS